VRDKPNNIKERVTHGGSYIEVEISRGTVNLLERAGDGKTREIEELLRSIGLRLETRVSTPCG